MKKLLSLVVFFFIFFSCKKDEMPPYSLSLMITGEWRSETWSEIDYDSGEVLTGGGPERTGNAFLAINDKNEIILRARRNSQEVYINFNPMNYTETTTKEDKLEQIFLYLDKEKTQEIGWIYLDKRKDPYEFRMVIAFYPFKAQNKKITFSMYNYRDG